MILAAKYHPTHFSVIPKEKNCAFKEAFADQPTIGHFHGGCGTRFLVYPKRIAMQGIITEPKNILEELIASRENGNVIGIWAPSLGTGLYMCAVDNILDDDVEHDKVVILKEKDLNGVLLKAHVLFLQEIEKVFPLKTLYNDALTETTTDHRYQ